MRRCRHVAEITKIELYKNSGKFIVYLEDKKKIGPIELDKGHTSIAELMVAVYLQIFLDGKQIPRGPWN